ncbi:MAG: ACP S-malonyltransferase [Treponema sp.]|jgi:[acyl-carrier-protein] S-malonyltransferase|nr:ACP S-malonyltransferase [Treponema sp.]
MIKKAFFLFPGQGAQAPGMAMDLLEKSVQVKELFTLASGIYGKDMAGVLANSSPETLKRTDVCQPAITLANLAAAVYLAEQGIQPCGSAGFSLGEYTALALAGVISKEDCFMLVGERGKAMQSAIDRIAGGAEPPGMAAVMGLEPQKVEALINEWKAAGNADLQELYAANINSVKQTVVSGTARALSESEKLFTEAGARRFMRLQVAGPYHSPFMASAADEFRPVLEKVQFNDPAIPLYSNVSGKKISSGAEAKKLALLQITQAVRWVDEEASILADNGGGIEALLEAGPGKVLQGLWKDSGSELPCLLAGTAEDIAKIITGA